MITSGEALKLQDTAEEELIYIVKENKKNPEQESKVIHNNKIKNFLKNQSKQIIDQSLDASGNLLSTGLVSLGVRVNINKVSMDETMLDTDKFSDFKSTKDNRNYFKNWYKYMIGANVVVGTNEVLQLFDDIKLPLKLTPNLGLTTGPSRRYEVTLPQSLDHFYDEKITKKIWNHLKDTSKIYRMVIPTRSKHLLDTKKYPSGSEFYWKRTNFILFSLGINLPTNYVESSIRTYFFTEGEISKRMKIYRMSEKTFVQVEIASEKENTKEKTAEISMGFSIFEMTKSSVNTQLRILTASKKMVKSDSFKLVYVLDLSYPQAQEALDEVFKNNFIKAQQYAVDNTNPYFTSNHYQGVLLLENHTQKFLSDVFSLNAGIFNERFKIKKDSLSLSINNIIPDIYQFSSSKSKTVTKGEYNYPFSMPINRVSLTLKKEKNNKILGGIWADKGKSILYNNEHLTYQNLSKDYKMSNQITLQERVYNKKKGEKNFKRFYEPNRYIFQLLKPTLSGLLHSYEEQKNCYKDYVMNKHLILHNNAIKQILNMNKEEYYKTFATILNAKYGTWWQNEKERTLHLKNHFKNLSKQKTLSSSLTKYLQQIYRLYNKMEEVDLIEKIKKLNNLSIDELILIDKQLNTINYSSFEPENLKISIIFHLTFREFFMEQGFIDYLTLISELVSPNDYFHGFTLKSDNCNIQWIGSKQSILNPESISKEIDELDLNFWDQ